MSPRTEQVLRNLRDERETHEGNGDGWADVYLDNAKPAGMSDKAFRSHLSALSQAGFYKPVDGYAWGSVRL